MLELMPTASGTTTGAGAVCRNVFCRRYGTCLDYAIKKEWNGFSCEKCNSFELLELDENEWREDYSRCRTLLSFVKHSSLKLNVNDTNTSVKAR